MVLFLSFVLGHCVRGLHVDWEHFPTVLAVNFVKMANCCYFCNNQLGKIASCLSAIGKGISAFLECLLQSSGRKTFTRVGVRCQLELLQEKILKLLFPRCVCVFVNSTIPNCSVVFEGCVKQFHLLLLNQRYSHTGTHLVGRWAALPWVVADAPFFHQTSQSHGGSQAGSWPAERAEGLIQKFVFNLLHRSLGGFSLICALSVNFFSKFPDHPLKLGLQMLVGRQKCTWACHQPVPPKGFLCSQAAKWDVACVHSSCWPLSEHSTHCCRISGKRKLLRILLLYIICDHCRCNLKTMETRSSFLVDRFLYVIPCVSLLDIIFLNNKIFGLLMCVSKTVGAV